jgi:hypothetical protein
MDPITVATASLQIPKAFFVAVSRALVPLLLGTVCACVAGGLYAVFLAHQTIAGFFSSAATIAAGVLIALIVNGLRPDEVLGVDHDIRAGTVALAAVGAFSAITGELVTGSTIVRGLLFALAWGGLMAGVLGLVFFLRAQSEPPSKVMENPDIGHLLGLIPRTESPTPPRGDQSSSDT